MKYSPANRCAHWRKNCCNAIPFGQLTRYNSPPPTHGARTVPSIGVSSPETNGLHRSLRQWVFALFRSFRATCTLCLAETLTSSAVASLGEEP